MPRIHSMREHVKAMDSLISRRKKEVGEEAVLREIRDAKTAFARNAVYMLAEWRAIQGVKKKMILHLEEDSRFERR